MKDHATEAGDFHHVAIQRPLGGHARNRAVSAVSVDKLCKIAIDGQDNLRLPGHARLVNVAIAIHSPRAFTSVPALEWSIHVARVVDGEVA